MSTANRRVGDRKGDTSKFVKNNNWDQQKLNNTVLQVIRFVVVPSSTYLFTVGVEVYFFNFT
jgi:hypothetical protein